MKVLVDHSAPFLLAHGGAQVQIDQTKAALEKIGVEAEYLRWWDEGQTGDLIHYFGGPGTSYQNLARQKKLPLVNTVLLTETCNRSDSRLNLQAIITRTMLSLPFFGTITNRLAWKSYLNSDCIIVGLQAEKHVLQRVYGVPEDRVKIIPIGCEDDFIAASPSDRKGDHLICVATITERKRIVELAEMAIAAEVPILFVGKPYSQADPYWLRFQQMAANSKFVRHQSHVDSRAYLVQLLQEARGFVLFTKYENWCIAADEAAACGLPLLLPDQKWARERFEPSARLSETDRAKNALILRQFFDECPRLSPPPKPLPWTEVAVQLREVYQSAITQAAY